MTKDDLEKLPQWLQDECMAQAKELRNNKKVLEDAIKKATEKGLPESAELGILGEYNEGSPTIWITRQQYEDLRASISPSGDVPRSSQGKVVWNAEKGCFEANTRYARVWHRMENKK